MSAVRRLAALWDVRPELGEPSPYSLLSSEDVLRELRDRDRFEVSSRTLGLLCSSVLTSFGSIDHLRYWLAPMLLDCVSGGAVEASTLANKMNTAELTWHHWGDETVEAVNDLVLSNLRRVALQEVSAGERQAAIELVICTARSAESMIAAVEDAPLSRHWFWLVATTPWIHTGLDRPDCRCGYPSPRTNAVGWATYVESEHVTALAAQLAERGEVPWDDLDALDGPREWAAEIRQP